MDRTDILFVKDRRLPVTFETRGKTVRGGIVEYIHWNKGTDKGVTCDVVDYKNSTGYVQIPIGNVQFDYNTISN